MSKAYWMYKILYLSCILLVLVSVSPAQRMPTADYKMLHKKEDSLKLLAIEIIQGKTSAQRFAADSLFTKIFVRALRINNSFRYPFDSLITISKLVPLDSSFRIYTWQMIINEKVVRQHGAIQMRTTDGSLKLFPLIDKSDITENPEDTVGNNFGWIGAVYYTIIQKEAAGKKYYTLLGYDENNEETNKKVIEVLTFQNGEPIFGGSYFAIPTGSLVKHPGKRFIMEFKKNAAPRLIYDNDQDLIIYGHLVSQTGELQRRSSYIPDGDFEGLKWMSGKWVHVPSVGPSKADNRRQVPVPIRDENGNIDETKLKDNAPADAAGDEDETKPPVVKEKTIKSKPPVKSGTKSTIH